MGKINRSAISGFISCFGMILIGIATNGGIKTIFNFIHIPSMIITFGGAVFAVLISVESMDEFVDGFKGFKLAFSKEKPAGPVIRMGVLVCLHFPPPAPSCSSWPAARGGA